ncbi:uncharacterized protein LOC142348464 isoform X2 [Convolutriloba macropyga]|uniref:uncharacterized protein LOC142348464 isoform X2 n=1 Tax=Convolutriloba macropyga TaxID=536237 RepID=UPI003F520EFB
MSPGFTFLCTALSLWANTGISRELVERDVAVDRWRRDSNTNTSNPFQDCATQDLTKIMDCLSNKSSKPDALHKCSAKLKIPLVIIYANPSMSKEKKVEAALEKIKECAKEEGISEEEVDGLVAAAKEAASNFDLSDLKNKLTNPEGAGSGLKESGPGETPAGDPELTTKDDAAEKSARLAIACVFSQLIFCQIIYRWNF